MAHYDPSPAALRPLLDMFWSPKGWRMPAVPPPPDVFARAVADGMMFAQAEARDHDAWIAAAREAAAAVSVEQAGDAFLESLSTRRLVRDRAVTTRARVHPGIEGVESDCRQAALPDLRAVSRYGAGPERLQL
jgi:hypothetical protein